jgi:hypothetical protein
MASAIMASRGPPPAAVSCKKKTPEEIQIETLMLCNGLIEAAREAGDRPIDSAVLQSLRDSTIGGTAPSARVRKSRARAALMLSRSRWDATAMDSNGGGGGDTDDMDTGSRRKHRVIQLSHFVGEEAFSSDEAVDGVIKLLSDLQLDTEANVRLVLDRAMPVEHVERLAPRLQCISPLVVGLVLDGTTGECHGVSSSDAMLTYKIMCSIFGDGRAPNLEELRLKNLNLGSQNTDIVRSLANNNLEIFHIEGTGLDGSSLRTALVAAGSDDHSPHKLVNFIIRNNHLIDLPALEYLSENFLVESRIAANLQVFDMGHIICDDADVTNNTIKAFVEVNNTVLKIFDITSWKVTAGECSRNISILIKANGKSLVRLSLADTGASESAIGDICTSIRVSCTGLKNLDLSHNQITLAHVILLLKGSSKFRSTIEQLRLAGIGGFDAREMVPLVDQLLRCPSLLYLDMSDNRMGQRGRDELHRLVKQGVKVTATNDDDELDDSISFGGGTPPDLYDDTQALADAQAEEDAEREDQVISPSRLLFLYFLFYRADLSQVSKFYFSFLVHFTVPNRWSSKRGMPKLLSLLSLTEEPQYHTTSETSKNCS